MCIRDSANNLYLPEEVANHPFVKKMEDAVANIGGLMNDIFSYEKEVIQFNSAFNLIAVFERYEKLSFTDALHESIKVVNDNIQTFLDGEANPHDFGDERLNKMVCDYVRHLRYQINATWHWQKDTDRYYSTTSPLPELRLPTEEVLVEEVPAEEVPVEAVLVEEVLVEAVPVEAVLVEEVLLKAAPVEAVLVEEVLVEDVLIEEVSVVETIDIVDETAVVDFVVQPTIASSGIKSNSKPVMAFPIVI